MTKKRLPKVDYRADGIKKEFKVSFDFQEVNQIKVFVDNQEVGYSFIPNSTVRLNETPAKDLIVSIRRKTDISEIVDTWSKGERFTANKQNKIQKQIFQALQEIDQEEIDSLDSFINGDMYLKLDMNGYRIVETGNPEELTDAVPRQFFIDMFPDLPESNGAEVGLKIGDTYLSSRQDEEAELVGGVPKNIRRDVEQTLISSYYPELVGIYGDLGGFTTLPVITAPDEGSGSVENITLLKSFLNNSASPLIRIGYAPTTKCLYLSDGNILYKDDGTGQISLGSLPSSSMEDIACNFDGSVIVAAVNGSPSIRYSTNEGVSWGTASISGVLPIEFKKIHFVYDRFIAQGVISGGDYSYAYSTDGINWISVNAVTNGMRSDWMAFLDNRIQNFYYKNGFFYTWRVSRTLTGYPNVVYKFPPDMSTFTKIIEVEGVDIDTDNYHIIYGEEGGGSIFKSRSNFDSKINYSTDGGRTISNSFVLPANETFSYAAFKSLDGVIFICTKDSSTNELVIHKSEDLLATTTEIYRETGLTNSSPPYCIYSELQSGEKTFAIPTISSGYIGGWFSLDSLGNTIHKYYTRGR